MPSAASQASTATSNPLELVEWWKAFDDPILTSLVERACGSNLDLMQAKARIRQARAALGVSRSGLWPSVNSSASYTRSGSGSTVSRNQDLFSAGLDAAWEIDIFGGVRRGVEASRADLQAAVEDRRDVLVSLVAEIGTNYADLRGFQQRIEIARGNLEAQRHTAEITRKRFEAGYVGTLDVASANAQVSTTESQIPLLESSAQAAIYNLSVLLGMQPAALQDELSGTAPIPTTPPKVPVGLPSELVRRRPDIRRAEADLHAATARVGVATADLFPRFSLTGNFGISSSDLASFASWGSSVWSFGPSITWPIFNAGRIRANIEVQNAIEEQALITYQKTVITALKDVETALVAYAKEQEHLSALSDAVENNRKAVDAALKLYTAGRTDFLNVLNAQRSLYVSEEALAQSTRNITADLIALYKALGGGWEKELGGGVTEASRGDSEKYEMKTSSR